MKQIKLLHKNIFAKVDDADYKWLNGFTWYYFPYKRTSYAKTFINGICISMQNLILKPPTDDLNADHVDGDGLNNQRSNLRLATLQQQRQNKSKHLGATSKYKGVSYSEERDKWVAQICIDGKQVCLGRFNSEQTAARVWNTAAKKHFGEFAKLNAIEQGKSEVQNGANYHIR